MDGKEPSFAQQPHMASCQILFEQSFITKPSILVKPRLEEICLKAQFIICASGNS